MTLDSKHIIYFLGIGGIGMSALARWFMHIGKSVSGYDKTATPLTQKLQNEGAEIHYEDGIGNIPENVIHSKNDVLVVYTPAIPANHRELNYLRDHGYDLLKRSEVLGLITRSMYSVAVAGTHGKTTTSSIIAHILKVARKPSLSIMGGILQDYESNLIIEGEDATDMIAVLEADEYDRSFLRLAPDVAVVTSADPDHLDIYGDHESMKTSYRDFLNKTKSGGKAIVQNALKTWLHPEVEDVAVKTYGIDQGENYASNVHIDAGRFSFDFHGKEEMRGLVLGIPGFHNVENATAAITVCLELGISTDHIAKALAGFKGVKRRFEYHIQRDDLVYIDDYAHHPAEIKAFIESVKRLYPGKKITAIFQPHLYSRTRDFAPGFAASLDLADEVILMEIYPARELPIEGVSSQIILEKMTNPNKMIISDSLLLNEISSRAPEVLLTIGAGDIDRFVHQITEILTVKS